MAANMVEENRPTNLKAFLAAGSCEYDPSVRTEEFTYPTRRKRAGAFHIENELEQTAEVRFGLTSRKPGGRLLLITIYIKLLELLISENSMMIVPRRLFMHQGLQLMQIPTSTHTIKEDFKPKLGAGRP